MDLFQSNAFRYRSPAQRNGAKNIVRNGSVSHNKWASSHVHQPAPPGNQNGNQFVRQAGHLAAHDSASCSSAPEASSSGSSSSSPPDTTWCGGEWTSSSNGSEDSTSVSSDSSGTQTVKSRKRRKKDRRRNSHARFESVSHAQHVPQLASASVSGGSMSGSSCDESKCTESPYLNSTVAVSGQLGQARHAPLMSYMSLPNYSPYWTCYDYEAIRFQQMALNAHYWKAYEAHQQLNRSVSSSAYMTSAHPHRPLSRTTSMPPPASSFKLPRSVSQMDLDEPCEPTSYTSKKTLCSSKSIALCTTLDCSRPSSSPVSSGQYYMASSSCSGSRLGASESSSELSDSNEVEMTEPPDLDYLSASRPPQRQWMILNQPDRTRSTSIFTIMSYNILCDKMATRQKYGYCPNWALTWDYRRKAIMDEIKHYNADIISLQEVETEQYYTFFLAELMRDGYEGVFAPKSRAKTMSEGDRKHVDGCAIFYRANKFSLTKEHLIEFNQLAMSTAEGSEDMLNRVMTKDNVGLVVLLETKEAAFEPNVVPQNTAHPLIVCAAHLHWDPEFCDVKLIQTMMLMNELRKFVEESNTSLRPGAGKSDANGIPLIMCGDLNSLPESGVVEFLSKGRVSADHEDFKELGYKDCLKKMSNSEKASEYAHPFSLERAYDDIMPFTNYTFEFKGIIDYIFYSARHFNVLGLLGALDPEWLRENKVPGCPHPHIPSDHFPLLVEFEMDPPALNQSNGLARR